MTESSPLPWKIDGPEFPDEEEKAVNISLGFSTWAICFGGHEFCLQLYPQWWGYNVADGSGFLIGLFTIVTYIFNSTEVIAHTYMTNYTTRYKVSAEPLCTLCKAVLRCKCLPGAALLHDVCLGQLGKTSKKGSYQFIEWGSHRLYASHI